MRAATILACLTFLIASMPAQARDYDDLSQWQLEDLCQKKDKRRHAEAIFAEFERRAAFAPLDLRLVRFGWTKVGMAESALECLWGAPDSESQADGAAERTYRQRIDGEWRTIDVFFVQGRVTDIRMRPVKLPPWPGAGGFGVETISEELFWSGRNARNWGQ